MNSIFASTSILTVEADPAMRAMLRQLLNSLGIGKIFATGDGEIAKSIIQKEKLDIVITDFRMKPISGIELAQWIRQDAASPNLELPIIMASAFSNQGHVIAAKKAGINGFLLKPLNIKQLQQRLTAVMRAPRRPSHSVTPPVAATAAAAAPPQADLDIEEFSF